MQPSQATRRRLDFLNSKPPPNYVPGLGRGATGFTTRSDIGPARPVAPPPLPPGIVWGNPDGRPDDEEEEKKEEFEGKGYNKNQRFDDDDKEVESIEAIYQSLCNTGKNEAKLRDEIEKHRASNPTMTEQDAHLKEKLVETTSDKGENVPAAGNSSKNKNKRKFESFDPAPDTGRVWMKSAIVERELGNTMEERRLLNDGLKLFPSYFKLWLMLGQLEERLDNLNQAKKTYENGLKLCSGSVPMWISLAKLEEKIMEGDLFTARGVLTRARNKNPRNPQLWIAAIRAESRHGYKKEADKLMAKALQMCPESGILWANAIEMVPQPQQKSRCNEALKKCGADPYVIAAVAKVFWHERRVTKARVFFDRAVRFGPEIGDIWALYYKFETQHGNAETQENVVKRCVAAEPKYGEIWQGVAKAVENSHLTTEAVLQEVVVSMGKGRKLN